MLVASNVERDTEVDLVEVFQIVWKRKWFIVLFSLFAAVVAVVVSLNKPNIYRAEALLAPVGTEKSSGGLSSMLGGLGGIASLAGVSLGGGGSVEQNIAVLKSREFIWGFVKDEKLMPILFEDAWDSEAGQWIAEHKKEQPSLWSAWRLLTQGGVLKINVDKKSSLIRLSMDWKDPDLAAIWVTKLVQRLNTYLREQAISQSEEKLKYLNETLKKTQIAENRQALFELISAEQKQAMLANTQQDFAFRVIDPAVAPDHKIGPKRALTVILATLVAGMMAIVFVFISEAIRKRKKENMTHNQGKAEV